MISIRNLSFYSCFQAARYIPGTEDQQYDWSAEQVKTLAQQLIAAFLRGYESHHEENKGARYSSFRVGAISVKFVEDEDLLAFIDGHQLFITLALMLICIHNRHGNQAGRSGLETIILHDDLGDLVDDFQPYGHYMKGIIQGVSAKGNPVFTPVSNLVARYMDIQTSLQKIDDQALPFFARWLLHGTQLEVVTAECEEDASILQRLKGVYG